MALFSRVQSKTASTGGTDATSTTIVFDSTPTAGNIIVLAVGSAALCYATGTNISFSGITRSGANTAAASLLFGRVNASPSATVTVLCLAASAISIAGAEYTCGSLPRLDQWISAVGSSASPASGSAGTTLSAEEVWVAGICARGTNANTFSAPTNSFTIVGQTNTTNGTTNTDRSAILLENIVSATGTPNTGGTITSNNWSIITASFEATPSVYPVIFGG